MVVLECAAVMIGALVVETGYLLWKGASILLENGNPFV